MKHKTDDNQQEIIDALRAVGATVQDLSKVGNGCPDILVGYKGGKYAGFLVYNNYLMEIKNPDTKGKLNMLQKVWHMNWRGNVQVVRTVEEALRVIGAID